MIIRNETIENSKGRIKIKDLAQADKDRLLAFIEAVKTELGVTVYVYMYFDAAKYGTMGRGSNAAKEITTMPTALSTEMNWASNLTI